MIVIEISSLNLKPENLAVVFAYDSSTYLNDRRSTQSLATDVKL